MKTVKKTLVAINTIKIGDKVRVVQERRAVKDGIENRYYEDDGIVQDIDYEHQLYLIRMPKIKDIWFSWDDIKTGDIYSEWISFWGEMDDRIQYWRKRLDGESK